VVKKKSDIPFGGNFSPNEVDLAEVLTLAEHKNGDRAGLEAAVLATYYADRPIERPDKLAYNVVLGMTKYGLLTEDGSLTPLAEELLHLRDDATALHRAFARHILVALRGAALVECVRDMQKAAEETSLINIRRVLAERGIHTASANKSISLMRLWLEKGGVLRKNWLIRRDVYEELLGLTEAEIGALTGLSPGESAVLRMLAHLGSDPVDSSRLRVATEKAFGLRLDEKNFRGEILVPLMKHGYIESETRRGHSSPVTATQKLTADVTVPLLDQMAGTILPGVRRLLLLPLSAIVADLDAEDINKKGLALEALAFKVLRVAGLNYLDTRYRPRRGGRFEVDLLFDSSRLSYSRWQVQCKNTDTVSLDDVAKEVGLTYYLLSNVIVVMTRGSIGAEARRYAHDVMRKTNLAIALMDGDDVSTMVEDPLAVFDVLKREAEFALELKPLQLSEGN
jgi:hypothetical protein